ncbi:UNVERIFIED_CONTAM: hypothetical protein ABID98_003667 [Brevibacillus sp. OAP136]
MAEQVIIFSLFDKKPSHSSIQFMMWENERDISPFHRNGRRETPGGVTCFLL